MPTLPSPRFQTDRALTPEQRARIELLCRIAEQRTANALAEYRAKVQAEVDKIRLLRELRMVAEAKAAGKTKRP